MIGAILHKEFREHRSIWLALAVVAAGALIGVPYVFEKEMQPQSLLTEMLGATAIVLAWTYGVVCGAMLLAGEAEGGTQVFLDTLPASRLALWRAKFLAGGLFVLLHLAVLVGLVGVQWRYFPENRAVVVAGVLVCSGTAGFCLGMFFSAVAKNALSAIGLAVLAQVTLVPFVSFPLLMLATALALFLDFPMPHLAPVFLGVVLLLAPLPLSALVYSRIDRGGHPWRSAGRAVRGWIVEAQVVLLVRRQMRGIVAGLLLFCVTAGVLVLGNWLLLWPIVTLAVGVFCGVAVFLDEQGGAYRFLGNQRLPLGRIWTVKVAMWLGVLFLGVVVVLLPSFVRAVYLVNEVHNRDSFRENFGLGFLGRAIPLGLFLFLFPIYGFASGCVSGILFRKPLVALVAGLGLAVLLAGVWIPSFLTGGLHGWQTIGPPVVLLVCARLLMRPWASDRLRSWETVRCVAGAILLSVALTALGLWYRVAEVPDVAEPDDFAAFVASLPTPEENQAGALIRTACSRLADLKMKWEREHPRKALRPGDQPGSEATISVQAGDAVQGGWPDRAPEVAAFLDAAFTANWWKQLAEASEKPVGVVEDPRNLNFVSNLRTVEPARLAGILLAARGLQIQKMKGDPAVFVDHFAIALALARNMRHDSPPFAAGAALGIERAQLQALRHWLANLNGRPDLLRRATGVLEQYEAALPSGCREQELAEYLIDLNSLAQPQAWMSGPVLPYVTAAHPYEIALLEAAWQTPWEKARQQRLLRAANWGDSSEREARNRELLPWFPPGCGGFARSTDWPSHRLVTLRAAELMLALRWFQAETGKSAENLNQLTPKYLKHIPADPFDGKPFRYRLSKGEEIDWEDAKIPGPAGAGMPGGAPLPPGPGGPPPGGFPVETKRKVPAGQGILWSVGEDRKDDGGKRQGLPNRDKRGGVDLIYLVPLPAAKGR